MDAKGELLITIMSSLAQEESRSISENTTWGIRKKFAKGEVSMGFSRFLGYDKDFVINEEETATVRMIYKMFIGGASIYGIKKELERLERKSAGGGNIWHISTIQSILTNEKYMGDCLLQKQYTVDFLTKKRKVNQGEIEQYYSSDHHPAIISKHEFEQTQREFTKRKEGKRKGGATMFSRKIKCSCCGGWYGSKTWHSTDKYKRIVYQCNNKYKKKEMDHSPLLMEDEIKEKFLEIMNGLATEKKEVIESFEELKVIITADDPAEKLERLREEQQEIALLIEALVHDNTERLTNQNEFRMKQQELHSRYERKQAEIDEVEKQVQAKNDQLADIELFLDVFQKVKPGLEIFDEHLWNGIVDHMVVLPDKSVIIKTRVGVDLK